ncbi:MAG: hypothetical protein ACRYGR_09625 [Janthinobacterium lividum]
MITLSVGELGSFDFPVADEITKEYVADELECRCLSDIDDITRVANMIRLYVIYSRMLKV